MQKQACGDKSEKRMTIGNTFSPSGNESNKGEIASLYSDTMIG